MRIVQLLPTVTSGDAVSNYAVTLKGLLSGWDGRTEIYAENISPTLPAGLAAGVDQLGCLTAEDVLIYHFSIGTPLHALLETLSCRKVMIYHNVTPPAFFEPYDAETARRCAAGRGELERMRDWFDYCVADSAFNRRDLLAAGYSCPVDVCPVPLPFERYREEPDAHTLAYYGDGRRNFLFVGRIAPNKRQEQLIRAFACYQRRYDPTARLILAGSSQGMESYENRLRAYTRALGVRNVTLTGHVSFPELLALYRTAAAFVCMSEHEGFCVPLLEAMAFDLPILACEGGAVAETLGGSGLLLPERSPELMAAAMRRVTEDEALRQTLIAGQRRRLEDFATERVEARFRALLTDFLSRPAEKKPPRVVQMAPVLSRGDAVSNDIMALRAAFRSLGCREEVWTWECGDETLRTGVRCDAAPPVLEAEDLALFHMGMGTEMVRAFAALRCRKAVVYHNITPPAYFEPYDAAIAGGCRTGLQQMRRLAETAELCVADSEFNRRDAEALGFRKTAVLPILIPFSDYGQPPEEATLRAMGDGTTNILFVGRVVPNKKFEDILRAFACYQQRYDRRSRLILAGGQETVPSYVGRLQRYAKALRAENVIFTGKIPFARLLAYYRTADAFLCLSEHEGFCVPLVEAMYFDVPVVARDAAAVGETLGGSGVLLPDADAERAAAALHRLRTDEGWRREILAGQRRRLADFSTEQVLRQAASVFGELLGVEHG